MTTDEAEAILEFAGRYWRNQWQPGASSRESRELILEAARVLLDVEGGDTERVLARIRQMVEEAAA